MNHKLDLEEIQGLILSGYGERPVARYALFEIVDVARARAWLKALLPKLQFSNYRKTGRGAPPYLNKLCLNIAFSYDGLTKLGLPQVTLSGFSPPFQEGLADPNRARRLGDDGESAPERWTWGAPGQPLHGVLAVFAGEEDADPEEWRLIGECLDEHFCPDNGVRTLSVLDTMPADRKLRKEHFGFRDGIANPRLSGIARPGSDDVVESGEFILGYKNGYGHYPLSPEVPAGGAADALPVSLERAERRDFGKNGSYLVFRQLQQHVQKFWQYVHAAKAGVPDAPPGPLGSEWLAAKFVGRWPNGTPLTRYPGEPGPEKHDEDNRFLFGQHGDSFGARCPIGSHIRRTNPRDTALPIPHDPELSGTPEDHKVRETRLKLSNLHRLLRRGRSYGEPVDPSYDPERMRTSEDQSERGLHFLCFNANLNRQFEFVQSNWSQNPTFAGLSSDPDPLLSTKRQFPFDASDFTIQGCPVRRVHDVPRVVEVRGGAYFFMPSRAGIKYLSEL